MLQKTLIVTLTALISLASYANQQPQQDKLFLVGGGLKTCSSMSINQCNSDKFVDATSKSEPLYQISKNNINLLFNHWPSEYLTEQRSKLKTLLGKMHRKSDGVLNKQSLRKLWLDSGGRIIINTLADREYYLMLDALELGLVDQNNQRRTEQVSLLHSKNPFSREIFQTFTQLSLDKATQKNKTVPNILVLTSSARDPYEAVDFYLDVFKQTGAQVTWLPIDAAINRLWQEQGKKHTACAQLEQYQAKVLGTIKRRFIYPDHFNQQLLWCNNPKKFVDAINNADGLFINGGDQSLTVQAFKNTDGTDNELLQAIRNKVNKNQLLVGGTSAGTAVMSGGYYQGLATPMITNGRSEVALVRGAKKDVLPKAGCQKDGQCDGVLNDDLTFNSQGGLGLFQWGIMDTHFSERGRQGRLVKLVQNTQASFAFGVDEATALVVAWQKPEDVTMRVVGQSGVFVVQKPTHSKSNSMITHYLTRDDTIYLNEKSLHFTFADWKKHSAKHVGEYSAERIFTHNNYLKTLAAFCHAQDTSIKVHDIFDDVTISITLNKAKDWRSASGALTLDNINKTFCSYQNAVFNYQVDK